MKWLLGRAVLAVLVLPGLVGYLVPWVLLSRERATGSFDPLGLGPVVLGTALLVWCVGALYRQGRGTLAPWDPPRYLVVGGAYRLTRNPMYIAVVLVLWDWTLGFRSRALGIYALVTMVAFHLRVVLGEEPRLARQHGQQWVEYAARVPRWFGKPRSAGPGQRPAG
jgi:protein-S-isoprenylcysteine O-methyltransferase Ste14